MSWSTHVNSYPAAVHDCGHIRGCVNAHLNDDLSELEATTHASMTDANACVQMKCCTSMSNDGARGTGCRRKLRERSQMHVPDVEEGSLGESGHVQNAVLDTSKTQDI